MGSIITKACTSQKWPVTIWGCLATLVSATAWRAGLMASCDCAVTRDWTSCNSLNRSPCDWGKIIPQYDGASFGYGEIGDRMGFHLACWVAIAWRWGTNCVDIGTYICFVPRWFHVDRMGTEYQRKKHFQNIIWKPQKNNEKTCRFRSLMEIERQILIKQEIACNWGFLYWARLFTLPGE